MQRSAVKESFWFNSTSKGYRVSGTLYTTPVPGASITTIAQTLRRGE